MCTGVEIALITAAVVSTTATVTSTIIGAKAQKKQAKEQEQALQVPEIPILPEPEKIKDTAREDALKRQRLRTQTVLTSPVGLQDEPNLGRKSLLGQ